MRPPRERLDSQNEIYQRLEPIGRNCEFGFVLRRLGSERSSLFRWTRIDPKNLIEILNQRFAGFFDSRNLVPTGVCNTIRDVKFKCVFHSVLGLDTGTNLDFDDPKLRKLYRIEKANIDKQISDFALRLETGSTICVLSAARDEAGMAWELLEAIDCYAGNNKNTLLVVSECAPENGRPGTIEFMGPRLLRGWLSRLAPGEAANQAEYDEWRLIIEEAIRQLAMEQK